MNALLSSALICFYPLSLFFFNDPATTEIYTLSLHDALPIYSAPRSSTGSRPARPLVRRRQSSSGRWATATPSSRSEEHTSELQSHVNLVCRLLLEKKNTLISAAVLDPATLPYGMLTVAHIFH